MTLAIICGSASGPVYPLTLELIAETTYPVNQAISNSIVMILPGLFGSMLIGAELVLSTTATLATTEGVVVVQTCSEAGDLAHEVAKDYTSYVNFLVGWNVAMWAIYVFGFFPELNRSKADRVEEGTIGNSSPDIS